MTREVARDGPVGSVDIDVHVVPRASRNAIELALGLMAALTIFEGCENDAVELPIRVVLPEDTTDLDSANNASLTLDPGGLLLSQEIDGLDFSLEVALEPDTVVRSLSLFIAEDTSLLAWGESAPFVTAGPDVGLSLFVGRPGRLSTFPRLIENPDPDLLAARAIDRGMLLLDGSGRTFLLNHITLEVEAGRELDDPPDPTDGGLFSSPDGSVYRVTWREQIRAWRYEPGSDAWSELDVDGPSMGRDGAAHLTEVQTVDDADGNQVELGFVHLFGGAAKTDAVSLVPHPGGLDVLELENVTLDEPRPGATASWVARDGDPTAEVVLFGGNAAGGPSVWLAVAGEGLGPPEPWTGGRCVQLRTDDQARMLCAGGRREGTETADALDLDLTQAPSLTQRPDLLPMPIGDPIWLEDEGAVYAQGAETLVRIERENLAVETVSGTALRGSGGHSVTLVTGATFLSGGVTNDGEPLSRWQVFVPAIDQ